MTSITIHTYKLGELQTNCYVVSDIKTNDTIIIDPGDIGNFVAEEIEHEKGKPIAIFLTHGHFDHMLGAGELQAIYSIPCFMDMRDQFLVERMKTTATHYLGRPIIELPPKITPVVTGKHVYGSLEIEVIHTPGHTPGSVSLYSKEKGVLFTGDTLFAEGLVGETNHEYSSALTLQESIKTLFSYPEITKIYPGHGEMTILDNEKIFYSQKNII